jgi:ligand-binding sensor domain-containing protein
MKKKKTLAIRSFLVTITLLGLYFMVSAFNGSLMTKPADAKKFYAVTVDDNDTKWFLTELGIVSFNGEKWEVHSINALQGKELRDIVFDTSPEATGFWLATSEGVVNLKSLSNDSPVVIYTTDNATLGSNDTRFVSIGANNTKWIGTDIGTAVFTGEKWLDLLYDDIYPDMLWEAFPMTALVASVTGDTVYAATSGVGVSRMFIPKGVDAIVGASEYAIWGPIEMPSDDVKSFHLDRKGVKWLGTDEGAGRHIGDNTLDKWTVFTTRDGLVHKYVQAITDDLTGKIWFGTQGGISVFDGSTFTNYTTANGLNSNNILSLAVDKQGVVWIGTDEGVNSFCHCNGTFNSFK